MSGKNDVVEFALYNKRAIFYNGTQTEEEFYIVRNPENSWKYRGILV